MKAKNSEEPTKAEKASERENYLRSRSRILEEFKSFLEEVQLEKPSVDGIIAGIDFQQFALKRSFSSIQEQKEFIRYTEKYKPAHVDLKEEKTILKQMISDAKTVYKKDYTRLYNFFIKN